MTLLEKARVLARAWSVQLAAIGAAACALLLTIDPESLQAMWQGLPPEIRALLPEQLRTWIGMALFIGVALARLISQPKVGRRLGLVGTSTAAAPPAPTWRSLAAALNPRTITKIVVHCTATREGQAFGASDIDAWHRQRGWTGIGYHFVVKLDGTIEAGRPIAKIGAHVAGFNTNSIGIVYVGGVASDGKTPKDTRTPAQKAALHDLIDVLKLRYPRAEVLGHRDFPGVAKACPSFDARAEYAGGGQ